MVKFLSNVKIKTKILFLFILLYIVTVSRADDMHADIKLAISAIKQGKYDQAMTHAKRTKLRYLDKLIMHQKIMNTVVDFDVMESFLKNAPEWVDATLIRKKAERAITINSHGCSRVLEFLNGNPITGYGKKIYAMCLPHDKAAVQSGWIHGTHFTSEEEQEFLAAHESLSPENHIQRIDNLIWKEHISDAKRALTLTQDIINKSLSHNKLIAALQTRIAFFDKSSDAEELFRKLPKAQQYSSGVLFAYLNHLKKNELNDDIISALGHIPVDKDNADTWWGLKAYYINTIMNKGHYKLAYSIARNHNTTATSKIIEAEWSAGGIALRKLNKPKIAAEHFEKIYNNAKGPVSVARGAYWLGRAYKAEKNSKTAESWFKKAATYGQTFYGMLAQLELKYQHLILPDNTHATEDETSTVRNLDMTKAMQALINANYSQETILQYAKHLINSVTSKGEAKAVLDVVATSESSYILVESTREATLKHKVFDLKYGFPTINIKKPAIELPLIYAVIRNESSFNQYTYNAAKDAGLMQIIPGTACMVASSINVKCDLKRLLSDPDYNILIGSTYLSQNIKYYDGSYLLGIVNYNAGRGNVSRWLEHQDPRRAKIDNVIDWIEFEITYPGVRNYVQRTFENLWIYRYVLGKPQLQIGVDLRR